jgi:Arc/MetJ-type ribon-helix-helix transcriptional regulator
VQITLSPEVEKYVQEKVASGKYPSPDAAVEAFVQAEIRRARERARIEALLIEARTDAADHP